MRGVSIMDVGFECMHVRVSGGVCQVIFDSLIHNYCSNR